jgi:hypothetical protein
MTSRVMAMHQHFHNRQLLRGHPGEADIESLLEEIAVFTAALPFPIYAQKSPLSESHRHTQGFDLLQSVSNALIELSGERAGWIRQHSFSGGRFDLYKKTGAGAVAFEGEFGHASKTCKNIVKLRYAVRDGIANCGVLLVPTRQTMKRIHQHGANFEEALDYLDYDNGDIANYPLVVLGYDFEYMQELNFKIPAIGPAENLSGNSNRKKIDQVAAHVLTHGSLEGLESPFGLGP